MLGIGVDIISMTRMAETLERSGDLFLKRPDAPSEIRLDRQSENPVAFFATAFAAKEALFKALTLIWAQDIDLRDMAVSRGPAGEPVMTLSGNVETIAREKGVTAILLSLSYEAETAIAMVAATGRND